jgi:2-oxoglutarate ferredoxin oxidoreductase subunit gamma
MTTQAPARTRTEILISGFGGQGVIRMGQILGLCAINQGHRVTMLKSHGTETRGGYVRTQVVIAPDYVDSPVPRLVSGCCPCSIAGACPVP